MSPSRTDDFQSYLLPSRLLKEFMMVVFAGGLGASFFGSYLILTDNAVPNGWIALLFITGMIELAALYGTVMKSEKFLLSRIVLQIVGILANTALILILVFRPEAIHAVEENKFDTFLIGIKERTRRPSPVLSGLLAHVLELVTAINKISYYSSIAGFIVVLVVQCILYILIRIHYSNVRRERTTKDFGHLPNTYESI